MIIIMMIIIVCHCRWKYSILLIDDVCCDECLPHCFFCLKDREKKKKKVEWQRSAEDRCLDLTCKLLLTDQRRNAILVCH